MLRVVPANQRLRAGDLSGIQVDFGLIVHGQFAAIQSAAQTFFNGLALDGPDVHGRFEKLIVLPAVFLGLVHRRVGILDQGLGIEAIVGIDAEADAGGDVQVVLIDGMGFGDGL